MKPGYYWAILHGEVMIVQVIGQWAGYNDVKTFMYGWQTLGDVEFLHTEPLEYGR